jgi:hypothetical protein
MIEEMLITATIALTGIVVATGLVAVAIFHVAA